MLRWPIILIRVRIGNLVRKDVGLWFLDRWTRHVRRHSWREFRVRGPRDRFSRHRIHTGLLFMRQTDSWLCLFRELVVSIGTLDFCAGCLSPSGNYARMPIALHHGP
ncbi:hypothetical protein PWG15_33730 (plasmid) [Ensifer adhaerens]|nr:hypothetical protein [Ensifer adhaerens]WDZ81978.1 hypothetical protein PWG15_33730 [Ensifer adhaerens]